ncbi:calcium-binding protein [Rhizobium herbae]|uniref:Calcium-binding protein n=1 Tax=Rhizobium herbae TaxID=508661 RepID=A0ABS4ERF8_9HYPH|nr:hypothetical protein [Rhizobium herbae]MBP1860534.1 hypothetical protein [Rhizobium herbae]
MAVTITVGTTAGLNYDDYLSTSSTSFLNGNVADPGYGEFYGTAHSVFGGPQHLVSSSAVDGTATPTEKGVLATGDFDYNFNGHTLDGTLNKVEFGYGPKLNTAGLLGADSYVTLDSGTDLTIDGLNLTTTGAGANTTHSILYGFISDTAVPLTDYLASLTSGVEFIGNTGNDTFTGYGYNDVISGGGGADTLRSAGGNDTINGGAGNDIINGGAGIDTLTGAGGNDIFVFVSAAEANSDTIADFNAGTSSGFADRLDLRGSSVTAFSGAAANNSIWFDSGSSKFFADTTGDATADFEINVASISGTLGGSDFIFV